MGFIDAYIEIFEATIESALSSGTLAAFTVTLTIALGVSVIVVYTYTALDYIFGPRQ